MNQDRQSMLIGVLLIVGAILFITAVLLISWEFYGAINFCHSEDGDYSFDFKSQTHYCNGKEISLYNHGDIQEWDFKARQYKFTPKLNNSISP